MALDRIAFSFKGAPSVMFKGEKIDLTHTLQLPNGKQIQGFKAADGTIFRLKKASDGTNLVVIYGEPKNLSTWTFKVTNGALTKTSFADGRRFGTEKPKYSPKPQSFVFNSSFKAEIHGLGKLDRTKSQSTLEISDSPKVSPRDQRLIAAGMNGAFGPHLSGELFSKILPFLSESDRKCLELALDNPQSQAAQGNKEDLLELIKDTIEHLDDHGVEAVRASISSPGDSGKFALAKTFFDSSRKEVLLDRLRKKNDEETATKLLVNGLERRRVPDDGNCFFHACVMQGRREEPNKKYMMEYRRGIATYVRKEGAENLAQRMRSKVDEVSTLGEIQPMDTTFLRNLETDATSVSDRSVWGNMQHARLLAASQGKPVVVIAPDDFGGAVVLMPDFSIKPLGEVENIRQAMKDTNTLARPFILVFDGINHWDSAVPRQD